jgi:HlyD family secretion protein
MRERLIKGLSLTEDQQRRLEPILNDMREQMSALTDVPEADRQQRTRRILGDMRTRVRELLTPAQQLTFDATASARARSTGGTAGRVFVVGADGKPKATPLTLGISDGTATEILRGDLKDGQEVIIGTGAGTQRAPAASSSGQPPRLRF